MFIKLTSIPYGSNPGGEIIRVNPRHIRSYKTEYFSKDANYTRIALSETLGLWVKETPKEIDKMIEAQK